MRLLHCIAIWKNFSVLKQHHNFIVGLDYAIYYLWTNVISTVMQRNAKNACLNGMCKNTFNSSKNCLQKSND